MLFNINKQGKKKSHTYFITCLRFQVNRCELANTLNKFLIEKLIFILQNNKQSNQTVLLF